jgi:hypothetical protein
MGIFNGDMWNNYVYIYIVYIYTHGISWYHGDIEWFGMRRSYNMKYEWYMNGILVK